jgi:catechol 2,3-dioxygenase-like lactoylglutathione lyase family enzyme
MMAKVTGLGGVFFKSKDPKALTAWYKDKLGIPVDAQGYVSFDCPDMFEQNREACTVWGPFPSDTKYMQPSSHDYMINFRVDDIEQLVKELKEQGVEFTDDIVDDDFGKFTWLLDPEGRKIELWQPPSK